MTETKKNIHPSRRARKIAIGTGIFVGLLIVAALILTSSAFLKGFVIPRIGEKLNAQITASEISLNPFSGVVARGVGIVPNGAEPLLDLAELRARYSLTSFVFGKPEIDEITLVAPKIQIIQKADGTSNLTPIQNALQKAQKAGSRKRPSSASAPMLSLKAISVKEGEFRFLSKTPAGENKLTLDKIQVSVDQIQNGRPGKFDVSAALNCSQSIGGSSQPTQSSLTAVLQANLNVQLDSQLLPSVFKGEIAVKEARLHSGETAASGKKNSLSALLAFDAVSEAGSFDLKQVKLTLPPTSRATNELLLTGKLNVNLPSGNGTPSQINLRSDALDLAPIFDFFADLNAGTEAKAAANGGPEKAKKLVEEPPGMSIPVPHLITEMQVGKVFIRDVVLSNIVTTLSIQTNVMQLNPLQLVCNGAAVTASSVVDVSKPGFVYDFKLRADKVPVEPFANSFAPVYKGYAQGDLYAFADIKGAGITETSLQKNLSGRAGLSFTNASIQLVGPKIRTILTPIAMLLRVPEVLQSPMTSFQAQFEVGKGNVDVRQVELRTEVFQVSTAGTIPIQTVLSNSPLNLPIAIALKRSIAQKSNLIPANAPSDTPFVALPVFATVRGTIGAPETKTDALVLAGLGIKSVIGLPLSAGEKTGALLQGIGKLLTGEKAGQPPNNSNPDPKANEPKKANPADLLRLLPDKKAKKP